MQMMFVRIMPAALLLAAASCGSSNPAAPSDALTGRWAGVLTRGTDTGSTTWQLSQNGPAVTGTWSVNFAGPTPDASGSVGGTVVGTTASLFLTPASEIVCPGGMTLSGIMTITATLSGERMTGSHVTFTCDSVDTGAVDVRRQ